jgi:hypothetical protein
MGEMGQAKENPYISHKLNILHYIFACMLEIQFLNIWQKKCVVRGGSFAPVDIYLRICKLGTLTIFSGTTG